jgi:hypothetical protein
MKEGAYRPQTNQPEQTQPLQGNAEGRRSFQGPTTVEGSEPPQHSPSLPPAPQEYPTLQQKSVLSRSVEQTRVLYERHGWTFLPLGEAGKHAPSLSEPQTEQSPHGEGINRPDSKQSSHTPTTIYSNPGIPDDLIEELNKLLS